MKLLEALAQNARILETQPHFSPLHDAAVMRKRRIIAALPSGSGFDAGTRIEKVNDVSMVFVTEYHHLNEHGFYDGWTKHTVRVTASFSTGFNISVSGRDKNGIKEYIADVFNVCLSSEFEWMN